MEQMTDINDKKVEEALTKIKNAVISLSNSIFKYKETHFMLFGWEENRDQFVSKDFKLIETICVLRSYDCTQYYLNNFRSKQQISKEILAKAKPDNLIIVYFTCHDKIDPDLLLQSLLMAPDGKKSIDFSAFILF